MMKGWLWLSVCVSTHYTDLVVVVVDTVVVVVDTNNVGGSVFMGAFRTVSRRLFLDVIGSIPYQFWVFVVSS